MSGDKRACDDQRQQVRTLAPAQMLHGQVHFAALNLQRRILGQRRRHLSTQAVFTCLEDLHLHDMGPVYGPRSERSNFWLRFFYEAQF